VGSTASFILMTVGVAMLSGAPLPTPAIARPVPEVLAAAGQLDPLAIANLGILVLMVTPVLRVIIAIIGFALGGAWRFVGVSIFVFALLLISFFVAA